LDRAFRKLSAEATAIRARDFILEGETIKLNAAGRADFKALQKASAQRAPGDIYLVASDLFHLNGKDRRDEHAARRREFLMECCRPAILFSSAKPYLAPATRFWFQSARAAATAAVRHRLAEGEVFPNGRWRSSASSATLAKPRAC
jgi:ATP-dependent DNA ligase